MNSVAKKSNNSYEFDPGDPKPAIWTHIEKVYSVFILEDAPRPRRLAANERVTRSGWICVRQRPSGASSAPLASGVLRL